MVPETMERQHLEGFKIQGQGKIIYLDEKTVSALELEVVVGCDLKFET